MELYVRDRILLPNLILSSTVKVSFDEYMLKKSFVNSIRITEDDKKKFKIESDEKGNSKWDLDCDLKNPLHVDLSKEQATALKKVCEDLSDKEYPDEIWSVFEKLYNACNDVA